jgi:hypothetical protein
MIYVMNELNNNINFIGETSAYFIRSFNKINYTNIKVLKCIVNNLCTNLTVSDIIINVSSCLALPSLLENSSEVVSMLKNDVKNIFSFYIKLMQDIDLDEVIISLEEFVNQYSEEVLEFSIELTNELAVAFDRYIKDSENSDDGDALSAASCVVRILIKLLEITSKKDKDLFYKIHDIISPIINWGLTNEVANIFHDILSLLQSLVSCEAVILESAWVWYPELFKLLIKDDGNGSVEEGYGFENLPEIIKIILVYIIKDPESFIKSVNKNNISLIDLTLNNVAIVTTLCKKTNDEVNCLYTQKIILTIIESYKVGVLDSILPTIVEYVINQLISANSISYKVLLIQTVKYIK